MCLCVGMLFSKVFSVFNCREDFTRVGLLEVKYRNTACRCIIITFCRGKRITRLVMVCDAAVNEEKSRYSVYAYAEICLRNTGLHWWINGTGCRYKEIERWSDADRNRNRV